ncbi:MAG: hypothetical protein NW226_18750 [Microscillaceae bacterium]|nr:hypothetical protein [Microscillaceae bacterium]
MDKKIESLKHLTSDENESRLGSLNAQPAKPPAEERISYKRVTEEELLWVRAKMNRKKTNDKIKSSILFFISLVLTGSLILSFLVSE